MNNALVAKSYQGLQQSGCPFLRNGKQYVNVLMNNGATKTVRVYTEKEYSKIYGSTNHREAKVIKAPLTFSAEPTLPNDKFLRSRKEVLGFTNGYITIFKGDAETQEEYFRTLNGLAKYCVWWGWYIFSTDEVPSNLPSGIAAVRLPWEYVGKEDGSLKPTEQVQECVNALLYEDNASKSDYVGSIGTRLERDYTVTHVITPENSMYNNVTYILKDNFENVFVWSTSNKGWSVNSSHRIRATVKEHKLYKNIKETVITRGVEL